MMPIKLGGGGSSQNNLKKVGKLAWLGIMIGGGGAK